VKHGKGGKGDRVKDFIYRRRPRRGKRSDWTHSGGDAKLNKGRRKRRSKGANSP